jgi:hypothetical protein
MSFIETLNSYFDFVDKIDKNDMFSAILIFMTVMFIWENYLSFRQVDFKFKLNLNCIQMDIFVIINLVFSSKKNQTNTKRSDRSN